jgi:hypothetical protein
MHDVSGLAEVVGEFEDSRGEALTMVEQQHLSHLDLLASLR